MKILPGAGFIVVFFLITIILISAFIIFFSYAGYSSSIEYGGMLQDSTPVLNKLTVK